MGFAFRDSIRPEPTKKIKMPKGGGLTKPMKLSEDLAAIVGKKEASRAECIKELWAYLKKNNLQDPDNKQYFTPDKKMAKVSVPTASVLSVWPSSCLNTFHNFSNFQYTFRKHADNDAPRKTEKKKLDKNHPWFQK